MMRVFRGLSSQLLNQGQILPCCVGQRSVLDILSQSCLRRSLGYRALARRDSPLATSDPFSPRASA